MQPQKAKKTKKLTISSFFAKNHTQTGINDTIVNILSPVANQNWG